MIDPIVSFLPSTLATNTDHGVRKSLKPLAALARRTDCCVLLVRHLRKTEGGRALYRGLGSIGFIASVRTGLFASHHPTDPTLSVLAVTKSNTQTRGRSLGYRIKSDPEGRAVVAWTGPIELSADSANQSPEAPLRMRDRASASLWSELAPGPGQHQLLDSRGRGEHSERHCGEHMNCASAVQAHFRDRRFGIVRPGTDWPNDAHSSCARRDAGYHGHALSMTVVR